MEEGGIDKNDKCKKCNKHIIEYESPGKWCRFCWAEWWSNGYKEYYKETLNEIQEKFGDREI